MLRRILIALGALVALLPYLGLPRAWDSVMLTVSGLLIVIMMLAGRSRGKNDASSRAVPLTPSVERTAAPAVRSPESPRSAATPVQSSRMMPTLVSPVDSATTPVRSRRIARMNEEKELRGIPAAPALQHDRAMPATRKTELPAPAPSPASVVNPARKKKIKSPTDFLHNTVPPSEGTT